MDKLELLLRMPRWAKRAWSWERLTRGETLFRALQQAVLEEKSAQTREWLNSWQPFVEHGDQHIQRQWQVVRALLTCAQIASGSTVAKSTDLSPLTPAAAKDALAAFAGQPSVVARSESISVLLLVNNGGVIAELTLEQLSGEGNSILYADPATMAFVTREQNFQEAEQNVLAHLRAEGLWKDSGPDVRWRLLHKDSQPLNYLEGNSAGGAFALGLAKLLAGDHPYGR